MATKVPDESQSEVDSFFKLLKNHFC